LALHDKRTSDLSCYTPSPPPACRLSDRAIVLQRFQRSEFLASTVLAVLIAHFGMQGMIMTNTSDRTFTELRIARAYVELSSIPENGSEASVLLTTIGNYEIRMFLRPGADLDGLPLFWLELFDHSTKRSVDGFSCYKIEDAATMFDNFLSQAGRLNKPDPGGRDSA
jgi:hypothetical protein